MSKKVFLLITAAVLILVTVQSLTAQRTGRGGAANFGQRTGRARGGTLPQAAPVPLDDDEKHILEILDDMNLNQSSGMMNVPTLDGRILRMLAETTNAQTVVEIGTSNGYSGIWFCLGLRSTGGKLITHDIDEGRASLARENFKRAGVEDIVTLVMGDAHETVKNLKGPIDILFLDADKEGYSDYLEKLLPLVREGGLILAHNIDQVGQDYINAITTNPVLETIQLEGVTVTLKKHQMEKEAAQTKEPDEITE